MASQKPRSKLLIFSIGGAILLALVALVWLYIRSQYPAAGPPSSPVQVFLLSPSSGDEVNAGDQVTVTVQSAAPSTINQVEVFVDGMSLGVVTESPENVTLGWQAWPLGIHTLSAVAKTSDGEMGQSQTVIVNVLAEDAVMQVAAEEGQTLFEVGAGFGVSPEAMADANPHIGPSDPLGGGQPVQVPIPPDGNGGGEGGPTGQNPGPPVSDTIPILINWVFQPTDGVDKSYCYTSLGDGNWDKMPKNPFMFFMGDQGGYTQYKLILPGEQEPTIKVQCWGWLGDVLKFLGEGQTKVNTGQPPEVFELVGDSFKLTGYPEFDPTPEAMADMYTMPVPPPFALREPADTTDCANHYILSGFICDTLLNAQVQQYRILEWEWQPKINWPGNEKWMNDINGYRVYEIDQSTNIPKLMKEINNPSQKISILPLPWGYRCYGVEAFADGTDSEGTAYHLVSQMAMYCPGHPPEAEMTVLNPTNWLTTGGQWIQSGDCDTYGLGNAYVLANQYDGFGNNPGEVLVGSYVVDDEDQDCYREGNYSGAVQFNSSLLPAGAVFEKALLKYSVLSHEYSASGLATNYKPPCVSEISAAKQDWTGQGSSIHFWGDNILSSSTYHGPTIATTGLSGYSGIDVSSTVAGWIMHPATNHGFILGPTPPPYPPVDGSGRCESQLGNFQLEIYYFTTP